MEPRRRRRLVRAISEPPSRGARKPRHCQPSVVRSLCLSGLIPGWCLLLSKLMTPAPPSFFTITASLSTKTGFPAERAPARPRPWTFNKTILAHHVLSQLTISCSTTTSLHSSVRIPCIILPLHRRRSSGRSSSDRPLRPPSPSFNLSLHVRSLFQHSASRLLLAFSPSISPSRPPLASLSSLSFLASLCIGFLGLLFIRCLSLGYLSFSCERERLSAKGRVLSSSGTSQREARVTRESSLA